MCPQRSDRGRRYRGTFDQGDVLVGAGLAGKADDGARPGCCAGSRTCHPRWCSPATAQEHLAGRTPAGPRRGRSSRPASSRSVVDHSAGAKQVDAQLIDRVVDLGELELADRPLGTVGCRALRFVARGPTLVSRWASASSHRRPDGPAPPALCRSGLVGSTVRAASAMGPEPRVSAAPPRVVRSLTSVVIRDQPSPTSPMRSSWMRASVKKTSLNSAWPVIWRSGRASTPGGACR